MKIFKLQKVREPFKKSVAIYMVLTLIFEIGFPSVSWALTSGPTQPEVQSFTPVGTSEMVDPFSGDFTYNIPLLDVDGYPINISYHSGITMDQEASWVGLGWNINPGVINRAMRGMPDDFDGELITKEFNVKPNRTFGINAVADVEFLGDDGASLGGVGYSTSIHFNNYNGIGLDRGISGHVPFSLGGGVGGSASLGITSSSDNGLSIQPNLSLSAKIAGDEDQATHVGLSVGCAFNSRAGIQSVTIGASVSQSFTRNSTATNPETGEETNVEHKGSIGKSVSSTFSVGMPTYTPQLTLPFSNLSISASFKLGGEAFGLYLSGEIGGSFSQQKLQTHTMQQPAYGYLHAENGVHFDNAVMDFNREKDVPFSPSTVALPLTNFTYDVLSVTGQGVGGSYRPFRSDFGHVFDPAISNPSFSGSIGAEVGLGELFKVGIDVTVNSVTSQSGRWKNDDGSNPAYNDLYFTQNSPSPSYEKSYYREANEKSINSDTTYLSRTGGLQAERYGLNQVSDFDTRLTSNFTDGTPGPSGTRLNRDKRGQTISSLTRSELAAAALVPISGLSPNAKPYHTAEITSTTTDGKRYVYGIAAYNNRQEETSFAVGTDEFGGYGSLLNSFNPQTGLIDYYAGSDNSINGSHGVDNYYSNTIMPAYAHSYLLTAVLSEDYVDIDNVKGPSPNDLGTYTKMNYRKVDPNFRWRVPIEQGKATYNEGLKWTTMDDKGSYTYGEKELWYLESVESKNYIAVFDFDNLRNDGYGVIDKNGGRDNAHPLRKLNKISLYTLVNYHAHQANPLVGLIPLKEVHFTYDYSLCQGLPNSSNNGGKLTLKNISFSYQSSKKGRLSPYTFTYSSENPNYSIRGYDRWGNFKPQHALVMGSSGEYPASQGISNSEYPYVEQDPVKENQYAQAWSLTKIGLPSGGLIQVDYESDDYAYVQNVPAGQMFKIMGLSSSTTVLSASDTASSTGNIELRNMPDNKQYFVIRLTTLVSSTTDFYNQYLSGLGFTYFRFLYNMHGNTYEYVPGYATGIQAYGIYPGGKYAYIQFPDITTNDNGGSTVSQVTKAAIQYGRLNEPKNIWAQPGVTVNGNIGSQLLQAILGSSFVANISDALVGPNEAIFKHHGDCQNFYLNKSWIRLNNPNQHKLGGGVRVKRIQVNDEWNGMTIGAMPSFSYGQEYSYTNTDGSSSGVASYEPQLGGDENSLHIPVFFDITHVLAPDDKQYMETPFGESFFPSPSVGYGRVTVQNIKYSGVSKHATGKMVHEFYTAKDFPTITNRTDIQPIREKTDPLSLSSFLHIDTKDYMTVSQGFYIETNDMHGKPKSQMVYQENIPTPISSIEYYYQQVPYQAGSYQLDNSVKVVDPSGNISNQNLGIFFDYVGDFREQSTQSISGSANINLDDMLFGFLDVGIVMVWPSFTSDQTRFRSASTTKVAQRFGILQKTIAKDLGSKVESDNLAYDAETGHVILTKTITDYNDPIYTLNFPAYWYYNGMGPAYQNIDVNMQGILFTGGVASISNASTYFAPGDEIELMGTGKVWVLSVSTSSISVEKADGTTPSGTYDIKVVRSGRKNMLSADMATITSLQNPLNGINSNIYQKVITSSGVEYNDTWSIFCDCINGNYVGPDPSKSYATGGKGNWHKKRAYAYLTGRTQTNYDDNTNARKDGVYTSFNPLYRKAGAKWQLDTTNWTFTSKVTMFNPNGQELENVDPLGRFSAATYGYNQSFATAVSANARYREIAFDNVEDYDLNNCGDQHFKFINPNIDTAESHTGRRSIRVSSSSPLALTKVLNASVCSTADNCDISLTQNCVSRADVSCPYPTGLNIIGPGATAPVTISLVILSGNPQFAVNNTGGITINNPNTSYSVKVTVTGAGGCTKSFIVSRLNGHVTIVGASN